MGRIGAAVAALFLCGAVAAQELLLSMAADLTGDGRKEMALLVGGDTLQLVIMAPGPDGVMAPAAVSPGIAWRGQPNEGPRMSVNEAGSLVISTANRGIGRFKWDMAVVVAHRDGRFVVAGLTFSGLDTIDPSLGRTCDLNLLTGKGFVQRYGQGKQAVTLQGGAPALADWNEGSVLRLCGE